jgi:hypothetical protein
MRTTLTLDDDVAFRLEELRRKRRVSLKDLVNEALRAGLDEVEEPAAGKKPACLITGVRLGRKVPNLDNIADVLAAAEDESWK